MYKFERNLSKAKPVNKYIPDYVPKKLKWCKKDSLMTYIDQLKHVEFNSGPDVYLDKALVINFDMIYKSIKGAEHKQQFSDRHYFTVYSFHLEKIPRKEREKALGACFRCCRKDFHVDKKLVLSNFLDK